MWFKQIQLFQIDEAIDFDEMNDQLQKLVFRPCLPTHHISRGWVEPVETPDEESALARQVDGYIMLCLQLEEKILPASVIREELAKKIKEIEQREDRKVRGKEKLTLKDEVIFTLLSRAFTKTTKIYGYIDVQKKQLILGSVIEKKTEHFVSMLKKVLGDEIYPIETQKLSPITTNWLKSKNYPNDFAVRKAAVLQDPDHANRIIRCQQQDLFASGIQALLSDGCEVKQLALSWHDQIDFVLAEGFLLQSIRFSDDVTLQSKDLELESKAQQFDADFLIMAKTFSGMLQDLLSLFTQVDTVKAAELVA